MKKFQKQLYKNMLKQHHLIKIRRRFESTDDREEDRSAIDWKNLGNQNYKKGEFEDALLCYSRGIEKAQKDDLIILLRNRSMVYLKLKMYHQVERDCNEILSSNPTDAKTLYRLSNALAGMNLYTLAIQCISKSPSNDEETKKLKKNLEMQVQQNQVDQTKIEEIKRETLKQINSSSLSLEKAQYLVEFFLNSFYELYPKNIFAEFYLFPILEKILENVKWKDDPKKVMKFCRFIMEDWEEANDYIFGRMLKFIIHQLNWDLKNRIKFWYFLCEILGLVKTNERLSILLHYFIEELTMEEKIEFLKYWSNLEKEASPWDRDLEDTIILLQFITEGWREYQKRKLILGITESWDSHTKNEILNLLLPSLELQKLLEEEKEWISFYEQERKSLQSNKSILTPTLLNTQSESLDFGRRDICRLHAVAYAQGRKDVVREIETTIEVNPLHNIGYTLLHHYTRAGKAATVEFLLKHGANPNLETREGETALDIAKGKLGTGNEKIVKLLEKFK